jgi:hypothetical protein
MQPTLAITGQVKSRIVQKANDLTGWVLGASYPGIVGSTFGVQKGYIEGDQHRKQARGRAIHSGCPLRIRIEARR